MLKLERHTYREREIQLRQGEPDRVVGPDREPEPDGYWCAIDGDDEGMPIEETPERAVDAAHGIIDCLIDAN